HIFSTIILLLLFRSIPLLSFLFFFFNHPPPPQTYTLSLHDALPISIPALDIRGIVHVCPHRVGLAVAPGERGGALVHSLETYVRSEEHTSELQSRFDLVCRLLLEKKKKKY